MELIFEIGCEELPASYIEPALKHLREQFVEQCAAMRVDIDDVQVLATPRRLTLLVGKLAEHQRDLEEVRTGPPAQAAFRDGQPTKAAEGFARAQGVELAELYLVESDKGAYVAARVFQKGGPVRELLPEILTTVIKSFHFPKSMRWASYRETFARPIRWILAVAGELRVPLSFAGVESGTTTRGHRFAAPGEFVVHSIEDYRTQLRGAHVVVDTDARRQIVIDKLAEISTAVGGQVIHDPALIEEVVYLVEDPHALYLNFGEKYLELPDEVLISSMRSHQRYFAIAGQNGALLPYCAVIYNTPVRDPKVVADGNLRVLKARLDDAVFFWEKDLAKTLDTRVEELENVLWLAKIGTMKARSHRMAELADKVAQALGLDQSQASIARRAAYLAKADLVSHMVGEFPDLQGTMGRAYALKGGEPDAVAQAIHEQYLPRSADDALPQSDAGACVALAERLDALVGCFGIGLVPTSAADPYGLRRAALGVLRIVQARQYSIKLSTLVTLSLEVYDQLTPGVLGKDRDQLVRELLDFMATRLKFQLAGEAPTDVVDAVLAAGFDEVLSVQGRVRALASLRSEPDFEPLAAGFKRVVNILRKQADELRAGAPAKDLLVEQPEQALFEAYQNAKSRVDKALDERNWQAACEALIELKVPVDHFFDHVMVMTDDQALRQNRLALLDALRALFLRVADISVIG
ncbi:MAG: glycine--tRNA ligase subunit beta [Bradymonadaceae bacterium]|nr:glycine--tRNA ligase subunit beta [Lujinxingiaceae bacterium]